MRRYPLMDYPLICFWLDVCHYNRNGKVHLTTREYIWVPSFGASTLFNRAERVTSQRITIYIEPNV
jgi:hypothetical protein